MRRYDSCDQSPPLILLVEDRQSNAALLQDALPPHGYRLDVARDGNEAMAYMYEMRPALILMDIQLPGMSGIEVIHAYAPIHNCAIYRSSPSLRWCYRAIGSVA